MHNNENHTNWVLLSGKPCAGADNESIFQEDNLEAISRGKARDILY